MSESLINKTFLLIFTPEQAYTSRLNGSIKKVIMKLLRRFKGVFIWQETFRLEPSQPVVSVSWGDCSFHLHGKFHSGLQGWTFQVVSLLLILVKLDYI